MAMDKDALKGRIVAEMQAQGASAEGEHAWLNQFAEALASAVVDEVQQNAEAVVSGGSSSGTHPVQ